MRVVFLRAATFMTVVIVVAIYLKVGWLRLFLVALRRWPLSFLVACVVDCFVLPLMPLSFGRKAPV
jgi:hypothetical protein